VPVTSPSKTAYADGILARADLSPDARILIELVREEWRDDPRDLLTRPERDALLGVGSTRGRELEQQGLPAYLTGQRRRVTPAAAIYHYKINQILTSFPSDEPKLKARGGPVIMAKAKARTALGPTVEPVARRGKPITPITPATPVTPEPVTLKRRGRPRKEPINPELVAEA
jgi:hypothetical protein